MFFYTNKWGLTVLNLAHTFHAPVSQAITQRKHEFIMPLNSTNMSAWWKMATMCIVS